MEKALRQSPQVSHYGPCSCLDQRRHKYLHHRTIRLVSNNNRDYVVDNPQVMLPAFPEKSELSFVQISKVHGVSL